MAYAFFAPPMERQTSSIEEHVKRRVAQKFANVFRPTIPNGASWLTAISLGDIDRIRVHYEQLLREGRSTKAFGSQ